MNSNSRASGFFVKLPNLNVVFALLFLMTAGCEYILPPPLGKPSISYLNDKATEGDAEAAYEMGNRYAEGDDVEQNSGLAAKWYLRAYQLGAAEGATRVAEMTVRNPGQVDVPFEMLEPALGAAARNDPSGGIDRDIAWLYRKGDLGEVREDLAAQHFFNAADKGLVNNWYAYANLVANPENPAFDPQGAVTGYERAWRAGGRAEALTSLGRIYHTGLGSIQPDLDRAVQNYREAEAQGESIATYLLGRIQAQPDSPHFDPAEARTRLLTAAQERAIAYYYLGWMYESMSEPKLEQAVEAYRAGAEQDDPSSTFRLAFSLERSGATEQARQWYTRALDLGVQQAADRLRTLEGSG